MALEPIQQLENLINESKNVLIVLPQNPTGDAIGSGWAFYFLKPRLPQSGRHEFIRARLSLVDFYFSLF